MPIRIALSVCVLVLGSMATVAFAHAGDSYGGFGPSAATETQQIDSPPDNGTVPPDSGETLPWLQQQNQSQPDAYSVGEQPVSTEEYDMDDEGGH
jgi:hypothetical protein